MASERFGEVLVPAQEPMAARAEFDDPAAGFPSDPSPFQADGDARLVLATTNPDKAAEILAIVGTSLRLVPRPPEIPDVEETGASLEVDALGGAPGLRSGRFAGEGASYADNVAKLLRMLDAMVGDQRRARVRTCRPGLFPRRHRGGRQGSGRGHHHRSPPGHGRVRL